jgi:hypothetical protein
MPDIEFYSFFCEDLRFENNGAPLMLGMMSPVFYPDEFPVEFQKLQLVSFFRAPLDISSFSSELFLSKISSSEEERIGHFSADIDRDDVEDSPYYWMSYSALPIEGVRFEEDTTLKAVISIGERSQEVYVTARKKAVLVT